jgi:hypothetical protein
MITEQIELAMQVCADDRPAGQRTLQSLMDENRQGFIGAAVALQSRPDAPGYEELMKLLARSDELVSRLCNPDFFTKEASIELARQILLFEPQLDTRLVRLLPVRGGTVSDIANSATIERILELLEAVSTSAKIVNPLAYLMRDPNPRLRAKAALLIGRRVQNTRLAEECLQNQGDARVRANAVESLWGMNSAAASDVFRSAAKDPNNRVKGNALLGLYRLRDQGAIAPILAMAADPRPPFRATAAWTIGQTADPRFLPVLKKLARDLYASVRNNAAKAIPLLPERCQTPDRLQLRTLWQEEVPDGQCRQYIQAFRPEGEPLRGLAPIQFILWQDQKLVTNYQAIERDITEPLGVGFVLCQDSGISGEVLKSAEEAVLGCLVLKRPVHRWAFGKFASIREPARPDGRIEPAVFLPDNGKLQKSIEASPMETNLISTTLAALGWLLPGVTKSPGRRHLILLAEGQFVPPPEMEAYAASAVETKVALHAVTLGSPNPSLKSMCQRTEGFVVEAADASELAAAYSKLYMALMHHYEILFRPEPKGPVRLEVYSDAGHGECQLGTEAPA